MNGWLADGNSRTQKSRTQLRFYWCKIHLTQNKMLNKMIAAVFLNILHEVVSLMAGAKLFHRVAPAYFTDLFLWCAVLNICIKIFPLEACLVP